MTFDPEIQFAHSRDGAAIAYWKLDGGPGTPLIVLPDLYLHSIELEAASPEMSEFYQRLAEQRPVVRYDRRGIGLSQQLPGVDFHINQLIDDLDAVIDAVSTGPVDLWGGLIGAQAMLIYTALRRRPVEHLILWRAGGTRSTADQVPTRIESISHLVFSGDFDLWADAVGRTAGGTSAPARDLYGAFAREAAPHYAAFSASLSNLPRAGTEEIPDVECPVLIFQPGATGWPEDEERASELRAAQLASELPNARLHVLRDSVGLPGFGDTEQVVNIVDDFLGSVVDAQRTVAPSPVTGALQTVLFTDLAGSTAMQARLGDSRAREVLRVHDAAVRQAISEFRGREVKHTGDGIMTSFGSAADAVNCALTVRRDIATYNDTHTDEELLVRFGLNAGEPIAEDDDLFGLSVTLAARIGDWGEPGQVLCSNVVRELLLGKGFEFSPVGEAELKGLNAPVPLYEVTASHNSEPS